MSALDSIEKPSAQAEEAFLEAPREAIIRLASLDEAAKRLANSTVQSIPKDCISYSDEEKNGAKKEIRDEPIRF